MSEESNSDKQHEPSQKKLEDARKKGEIPRSSDLSVAAGYGGVLLLLLGFGASGLIALGSAMTTYLEQVAPPEAITVFPLVSGLASTAAFVVAGWLLVPMVAILALLFALKGIIFAPEKLVPKLSRISLISNAKNKFGRNGLFEFVKNFGKLVIYSVCLTLFLKARLGGFAEVMSAAPSQTAALIFKVMGEFFCVAFLVAASIGGIDYAWQYNEHLRKNRMSDKELRDEQKEAEGDPHMKGSRRQRAQEIATNQMVVNVPNADVVIVNPEHFAVALQWNRASGSAPVCVAKGVDEVALVIKTLAREHSIPIHSDPPTARALYASTELEQEIPTEQYKAVAAAIRFADEVKRKLQHGQ